MHIKVPKVQKKMPRDAEKAQKVRKKEGRKCKQKGANSTKKKVPKVSRNGDFIVSVLLSAYIERFSVSSMQDFSSFIG